MESHFMFNFEAGGSLFLRRAKNSSNSKKEEKAVTQVFDPFVFYDSAMEKSMMLSALSA